LIKIFVIFERLENCTFPRGIWNSYLLIQQHTSELKSKSVNEGFDKEFADFVTEHLLFLENEYNKYLVNKLVQEPTITTIETETKYFLDKNIPAYIEDTKNYINEMLVSKSRKATKLRALSNEILICNELLAICAHSNFKLLEAQIQWLVSKKMI
jgi:hypothetical protein